MTMTTTTTTTTTSALCVCDLWCFPRGYAPRCRTFSDYAPLIPAERKESKRSFDRVDDMLPVSQLPRCGCPHQHPQRRCRLENVFIVLQKYSQDYKSIEISSKNFVFLVHNNRRACCHLVVGTIDSVRYHSTTIDGKRGNRLSHRFVFITDFFLFTSAVSKFLVFLLVEFTILLGVRRWRRAMAKKCQGTLSDCWRCCV